MKKQILPTQDLVTSKDTELGEWSKWFIIISAVKFDPFPQNGKFMHSSF